MGAFIGLFLSTAFWPWPSGHAADARPCYRNLVQYHWFLDAEAHTVKRLAKGKAPFVSCDEFPAEKTDNVVLEVFATGGKVVHRQSIFLPLTRYFDYVVENADRDSKKKRRYVGGARGEESQAAVTVALPESVARFDEKLKIRFFSVKGHRLLGEGSL